MRHLFVRIERGGYLPLERVQSPISQEVYQEMVGSGVTHYAAVTK